jgi:large subunit ribosomal protein L21
MFAVVRSGGKQFKVTEEMKLKVPVLDQKVGDEVVFTDVLLLSAGERRLTGNPTIAGASVTAEVLRHGRDEKQTIFRYKRRKGYHRKQGHRQGFTEVRIKSITVPEAGTGRAAAGAEAPKAQEKQREAGAAAIESASED